MEPITIKVLYHLVVGAIGTYSTDDIKVHTREYTTEQECKEAGQALVKNQSNWVSIGDMAFICVRFELTPNHRKHS